MQPLPSEHAYSETCLKVVAMGPACCWPLYRQLQVAALTGQDQ